MNFTDYIKKSLQEDSELKKEYDALAAEYELISQNISAQTKRSMASVLENTKDTLQKLNTALRMAFCMERSKGLRISPTLRVILWLESKTNFMPQWMIIWNCARNLDRKQTRHVAVRFYKKSIVNRNATPRLELNSGRGVFVITY